MMQKRPASLLSRLQAGETLFTAWSGIPDALTVELVADQGFDIVTLDMQHGGHNEDSVLRSLAPVLSAGKHALVRIPVGRNDMASRALDFGAEGVIAPMINSAADARAFAASMKYPPLGERSWGPTFGYPRAGGGDGPAAWLAGSNSGTLAIAMIETRAALDALDGILGTPGIDGIFVGPSDFSIAWSNGAIIDPGFADMMETIASIARRAGEAGKFCSTYCVDPGIAGKFHAMGFRLFAIASEHKLIAAGSQQVLRQARESIS